VKHSHVNVFSFCVLWFDREFAGRTVKKQPARFTIELRG
jgi:hypothetical protein